MWKFLSKAIKDRFWKLSNTIYTYSFITKKITNKPALFTYIQPYYWTKVTYRLYFFLFHYAVVNYLPSLLSFLIISTILPYVVGCWCIIILVTLFTLSFWLTNWLTKEILRKDTIVHFTAIKHLYLTESNKPIYRSGTFVKGGKRFSVLDSLGWVLTLSEKNCIMVS